MKKFIVTNGRKLCVLFTLQISIAALNVRAEDDCTKWMAGSGIWTDAARWSDGLPNSVQRVEVHGNGTVVVPTGTYVIGNMEVGLNYRDHVRVEVDGGQMILLQDSLRVGELSGGEGEFILKDGAMHTYLDTYVGAANGVPG